MSATQKVNISIDKQSYEALQRFKEAHYGDSASGVSHSAAIYRLADKAVGDSDE